MPDVVRSIEIAAPPARVWRWFTSQDALRQWWGVSDLRVDLRVGGGYTMTGPDGETRISGAVLVLEPERLLVLSWLEEGSGWVHPARLVFALEPVPGGTRVELRHEGFAGIGTAHWQRVQDAYERGADLHAILPTLAARVADDAA